MFTNSGGKNMQLLIPYAHDFRRVLSPCPRSPKINRKSLIQNLAAKKIKTLPQQNSAIPKTMKDLYMKTPSSKKVYTNESLSSLSNLKWGSLSFIRNLSRNHIRTTVSYADNSRKEASVLIKNNTEKETNNFEDHQNKIDPKLTSQQRLRFPQKQNKQTPSFIKNKLSHTVIHNLSFQDFKQIKTIKQSQSVKEYLTIHKKTQGIFIVQRYSKSYLLNNQESYNQLKFLLKSGQMNHCTIIKHFGFFVDKDYINLVEEYFEGELLEQFMKDKNQCFTETELGSKICEILTAVTFLHSKGRAHGHISQQTVFNSINICKIKRPCWKDQNKDYFYDIWCLGKLAYEMATNKHLIPDSYLQGISTIDEIFQSKDITKSIEVGFKFFENASHSRDLIHFLITTLWTVQHKQIDLKTLWEQEFIKLFREDEAWLIGQNMAAQSFI